MASPPPPKAWSGFAVPPARVPGKPLGISPPLGGSPPSPEHHPWARYGDAPLTALDRDEAVRSTNDDAQECKFSAVTLGYFEDPFVKLFTKKRQATIRSPIINRGYWSRVQAINTIINDFISLTTREGATTRKQVVVLGAGFDTTYFQLKSAGKNPDVYVEIDFPEIVARKAGYIRKHTELTDLIPGMTTCEPTAIHSSGYHLIAADVRDIAAMEKVILTTGLDVTVPTLFLSECVIIYLEPAHGDSILSWAAGLFERAAFVTYEQILPHDAFGVQMVNNLKSRGCALHGIEANPDLAAQRARYLRAGWQTAQAHDMNDIYSRFIDSRERQRIEKIELFDELEEWNLIQSHYCIVLATVDKIDSGLFEVLRNNM